jgi:hypothetical protein
MSSKQVTPSTLGLVIQILMTLTVQTVGNGMRLFAPFHGFDGHVFCLLADLYTVDGPLAVELHDARDGKLITDLSCNRCAVPPACIAVPAYGDGLAFCALLIKAGLFEDTKLVVGSGPNESRVYRVTQLFADAFIMAHAADVERLRIRHII